MLATILTFQVERPVFVREQANKMYSVTSYYNAKMVSEVPILCLSPLIYSVIIYFKMGLTIETNQFFYFYLINLMEAQCGASFGYFISSVIHTEETAVALCPIIMMPIVMFGGLFANAGTIKKWISWFQYLSCVRYGFEAIVINEYDHRTYDLSKGEMNPKYFLDFDIGMWKCLVILAAMTVILRGLSLLFLKLLISKFQ